jgi:hypothetical protein
MDSLLPDVTKMNEKIFTAPNLLNMTESSADDNNNNCPLKSFTRRGGKATETSQ